MEARYYTPALEEFHVGFEYEIYEDWNTYPEKKWWKQVYSQEGANPERLGYVCAETLKRIRVKCLDHEDCLALGFTPLENKNNWFHYQKGNHNISFSSDYLRCTIEYMLIDKQYSCVFCGDIKNKSELKRLLRQIGVQKTIGEQTEERIAAAKKYLSECAHAWDYTPQRYYMEADAYRAIEIAAGKTSPL